VFIATFPPSEPLRHFVEKIQVMETDAPTTRAVLPSPGVVLGIRYAGSATLVEGSVPRRLGNSGVTGIRTTLRRMHTSAGGGIVVVNFRTLGAAQFFEQPLHEIFGEMVRLDELEAQSELDGIEERVALAATPSDRARVVDAFLCKRLRDRSPDPLVAAAAAAIRSRGGVLRIHALAKELGTSQDPLEKRFRRTIGASPKQFASIIRFLRVVRGFERGKPLTELAHEAGYYDQPHLVHDFRSFTGEAPERFLRSGEHC
jgi:methylphosphotriester-DNA--protein-cysteine methyltransferase